MSIKGLVNELRSLTQPRHEKSLDVVTLEQRKQRLREMTTTANVGGFMVPLGAKIVRAKNGAGDIQGNYPPKGKKKRKLPSYWPL